jgi:hypothetical protein
MDEYDKSKISNIEKDGVKDGIIEEWYVNDTENLLIIKYDKDKISEDELKSTLK